MADGPSSEQQTRRFVRDAIGDVLAHAEIDIGFQPVVDLATEEVVGYEALARGPQGSMLESPDHLFAAARAAGRLDELDWLCQRSALRAALAADLRAPSVLFINIEPDTSGFMPLDLRALYAEATAQMTVTVEVTERALTDRPANLLGHVADMRALGCAIALDDVGAEIDSLAMMAVLAPEVIKLDLALIEASDPLRMAELMTAVIAHAERSDATILVERVETAPQAELADALGATLAQGWLFGRRGAIDGSRPRTEPVVQLAGRMDPRDTTPFALVAAARRLRRTTREMLDGMSQHLEEQARRAGHAAVIVSSVQRDERFSDVIRARYEALAADVAFCGVVGDGIAPEPVPGVRGGSVHASDPIAREWSVTVVSPHFAAALIAHELEPDEDDDDLGPDDGPRYDFVLTHDRDLVVPAAAALMARIAA